MLRACRDVFFGKAGWDFARNFLMKHLDDLGFTEPAFFLEPFIFNFQKIKSVANVVLNALFLLS